MKQLGNTLYDLIDDNGEYVTYQKTTVGYEEGRLPVEITPENEGVYIDGVVHKKLVNGEYARRVIPDGRVNVNWFGAIADDDGTGTGTDNSEVFQRAVWAIHDMGGGVLVIPPTPSGFFYRIQKVYVLSGVNVQGVGALWQNNFGGKHQYRGTKIVVGDGGLGFVFGHPAIATRSVEANMSDVYIKGTPNAISGLRLGSDVNYSPANNSQFRNVRCEYFTSYTAVQPIMDKSTIELGSERGSFSIAQSAIGGCGLFISSATWVDFHNCNFGFNYNGVVESSPRNSYRIQFFGGQIRTNDNWGIILNQARFVNFFGTDLEANVIGTIKNDVPIQADNGRFGISDILFIGCHFENVGETWMYIRNQNYNSQGLYANTNISVRDCSYLGGSSTTFAHLDGISGVRIELNNPLISGVFYTRNIGRNPVKFAGGVSNMTFDIYAPRTIIDDTTIGINTQDCINSTGGGLNYSFPNVTTNANSGLKHILSYDEVPANTLAKGDRKKLILEANGVFASNDNMKTILFEWETEEIIRNTMYTHPNGVSWNVKIEIIKESSTSYIIRSIMTIGGNCEKIVTLKKTVSANYWEASHWCRMYGHTTVNTAGEITCYSQNSELTRY